MGGLHYLTHSLRFGRGRYFKVGAVFLGARGTNDTIIDGTEGSLRLNMSADLAYLKKRGGDWEEIVPNREGPHGVVGELTHFVDWCPGR